MPSSTWPDREVHRPGVVDAAKEITEDALVAAGLTKSKHDGIRKLAKGAITSKVTLVVTGASASAIEAVKAAGGSLTVTAAHLAE